MTISLLDRVENIVGKGENAGNQHFLLFLQCFPKPSSLGFKRDCVVVKLFLHIYDIYTPLNTLKNKLRKTLWKDLKLP